MTNDNHIIARLLEASRNENPHVRLRAIQSLAKIGDPRIIPVLLEALGDAEPPLRAIAATALGKLRAGQAKWQLLERLGDEDAGVRLAVIETLGRIADPDVVPGLSQVLRNAQTPELGIAAVRALAQVGGPAALATLQAAARDGLSHEVRDAASRAIASIQREEASGERVVERAPVRWRFTWLILAILALPLIIFGVRWVVPAVSAGLPTPTARERAQQRAEAGVTRNTDWTPYTEEIDGIEMALVPKGCFMMGSTDGASDEQPVHQVCFEKPFWIDVYEVIQLQFSGEAEWQESCFTGLYLPRECITWAEAAAFCEKRGGRLPTEAEWEYAARGPDGLAYPWGNEFVADNVVYRENAERTRTAGSKPEGISWIGAYDLSGNVWEWVNDWYGAYPSGRQVNPMGPDSGDTRVIRGGSWTYGDDVVRAADRYSFRPDFRDYGGGFRCSLAYQP